MNKLKNNFKLISGPEDRDRIAFANYTKFEQSKNGKYEWNGKFYRYVGSLDGTDYFEEITDQIEIGTEIGS